MSDVYAKTALDICAEDILNADCRNDKKILGDSGERITYGDGMAIREPRTGKGRYELISPYALRRLAKHCENGSNKYSEDKEVSLDQLEELIINVCHEEYGIFFNTSLLTGDVYFGTFRDGKGAEVLSITSDDQEDFYNGCIDYMNSIHANFPITYVKENGLTVYYYHYDGGRNWEKGMPYSRYLDSAMRHLQQVLMGMTDEDHLAAASWNLFAIMHHQELGESKFDDLPHYEDRIDVKNRRGVSC